MAQLDNAQAQRHRTAESTHSPTSPTVEQLLQGESSIWPGPGSPACVKDHFADHHGHNKKSVLAKVRDRAKKWKQTLGKKKQSQFEGNAPTPSWGVSLADDDEDTEEDPEYLGAPMYESELAPEECKEAARQHPREVTAITENKISGIIQNKEKPQSPKKTVTQTVTQKLTPAYEKVAEATHTITSKIQNLAVGTPSEAGAHPSAADQMWDKGASVKDFLMHKLEPGEDEKALSQVISAAISPRKSPGELGRVEKVREAVTSLIQAEEPSPLTVRIAPNTSSPIPISTNAHHEDLEEENQGRILQTN